MTDDERNLLLLVAHTAAVLSAGTFSEDTHARLIFDLMKRVDRTGAMTDEDFKRAFDAMRPALQPRRRPWWQFWAAQP